MCVGLGVGEEDSTGFGEHEELSSCIAVTDIYFPSESHGKRGGISDDSGWHCFTWLVYMSRLIMMALYRNPKKYSD